MGVKGASASNKCNRCNTIENGFWKHCPHGGVKLFFAGLDPNRGIPLVLLPGDGNSTHDKETTKTATTPFLNRGDWNMDGKDFLVWS